MNIQRLLRCVLLCAGLAACSASPPVPSAAAGPKPPTPLQNEPTSASPRSEAPRSRPSAFVEPSDDQQILLADGIALFSRGENELAVVMLTALARSEIPSTTRLLGIIALAQLYLEEGQTGRALSTMVSYRDHFPVEQHYQSLLAALYDMQGEKAKAIEELEALAEHTDAVPEVLARLVHHYHESGDVAARELAASRYEQHLTRVLALLADQNSSTDERLAIIERIVVVQDERLIDAFVAMIGGDDLQVLGTVVEELVNYAEPSFAAKVVAKAIERETREPIRNGLQQALGYLEQAPPSAATLPMPLLLP